MTKFEIVIPSDHKDVFDKCLDIVKGLGHKWVFAEHPADENATFQHYHLGVFLPSSRTVDDIFKWFNGVDFIRLNSIEKIRKHQNTYMTYLMHKTKDAILAGKSAPISWGCSDGLDFDAAVSAYEENISVDDVCDRILSGELRECDIYSNDDLMAFVGHSSKVKAAIDNAVKCYYNSLLVKGVNGMSDGNERKQAWIYGPGGSGKTVLAKYMFKVAGYADNDIYVTSSGKNPFDNYMGQRCVLIDDIDGDTMSPKTALKLMDMFTSSAIAARYSNKVIAAECICITSTISPHKWWEINATANDGNVKQLLRRLTLGTYLIKDIEMAVTSYDSHGDVNCTVTCKLPEEVQKYVDADRQDFAMNFLNALVKRPDGSGVDISVKDIKADESGISLGAVKMTPIDPGEGLPFDV